MNKLLVLLIFAHLAADAQPQTKQVLVEGKGQPIVLLNGGTFDMTAFTNHSKLLADSFTVIRMQQFNIQYADAGMVLPKNYSATTESEAINTTLDSLGIKSPIILVGHSYGGVIAFDFALRHPDRIRALVLVEAPLFDVPRTKGKITDQMKEIEKLTRQFTPQTEITEDMIRRFRCAMSNCDSFDIRQHPMWPKWLKQKDRLKGLSAVPAYQIDFRKLHDFKKPVLIVTGTKTIEANKIIDQMLSIEFLHSKTVSLPGDHIAVYQNAESFIALLTEFLRESR